MTIDYVHQRYYSAGDLVSALRPIRSTYQVAKMIGVSRSMVFYIERDALRKIRERLLAQVQEPQSRQRISFSPVGSLGSVKQADKPRESRNARPLSERSERQPGEEGGSHRNTQAMPAAGALQSGREQTPREK